MSSSSPLDVGEVTRLLRRIDGGDQGARDELVEAVYDDLRVVAQLQLGRVNARGGGTLQPTALVNETYLRLVKQRQRFDNRAHFFAIATTLMIRILRDHHRRNRAGKRGGGADRVTLDSGLAIDEPERIDSDRALAVLDALEQLDELDARKAEVVKLRVLWGLTHDEIASALSIGRATVDRDWQFARAWLSHRATEAGS